MKNCFLTFDGLKSLLIFISLFGQIILKSQSVFAQNTYYGTEAGTLGDYNANFGYRAGKALIANGKYNANFGAQAGISLTTGQYNTNIGFQAAAFLTLGSYNSNIGYQAGYQMTTARYNINLGSRAGNSITTGLYNINIGYSSGNLLTTGESNVMIGSSSGGVTDGIGNVFLGANTGSNSTNLKSRNVLIGYSSGDGYSFPANKSILMINNQSRATNPLLYGYFHDLSLYDTTQRAQLAINTNYIEKDFTLTVNGPTYIGNFEPNGINHEFVKDSLLANYYLWVEKGVVSEDFAIGAVKDWGDYVFSSDYTLHPLSEVEKYIGKHQHLPGIPSAAQLQKDGMSLAMMSKNFMVKIEELTLYAIEQEKQIKELKSQLDQYKDLAGQYEQLFKQVEDLKKVLSSGIPSKTSSTMD
ncbi:hypothetical protein [Xanthocytophaga flava]|uniref:hypothetical protein n=1 Tax=Xanthocytophaga flava TaxID=3048013 RepID=UPI0028D75DBB|nr:hypothetical protein [Xanthocytophaga flavus]MDJ1470287.1 hypothetical protein [Xanthocytophaga flavus]